MAANDRSFFQEIGEVWSENLLLNVYIKLNADAKKDLYTRTRISFLFFYNEDLLRKAIKKFAESVMCSCVPKKRCVMAKGLRSAQ